MAATSPLFSARVQRFFPVLIAVLAMAFVSVCGDLVVGMFPLHLDDAQWRLIAVGGALGQVPQLAVLLGLASAIGILGGVRGAVRGAAITALLGAVVTVLLLFPFGLDFLQVRRMVAESNKRKVDVATIKTILFAGVFALMLIWTGVRGWQLSKKEATAERGAAGGLVVGQG